LSSPPHAAQLLRELHSSFVLALVSEVVADDDPELRASLIGAHLRSTPWPPPTPQR
jgi:hypothetical protein